MVNNCLQIEKRPKSCTNDCLVTRFLGVQFQTIEMQYVLSVGGRFVMHILRGAYKTKLMTVAMHIRLVTVVHLI